MGFIIFLIVLFLLLAFWKEILWVIVLCAVMLLVFMMMGVVNVWGGVDINNLMSGAFGIVFGFLLFTFILSMLFESFRNFIVSVISSLFGR